MKKPMMPAAESARRMNPEEKIEKVIQAAQRLFVNRGYCEVSIPDIVKESGVSTGSIYNYFKDKETLALEIHTRTIKEFDTQFRQSLNGSESVYEVLKTFTSLMCELTENNRVMMQYMLHMQHGGTVTGLKAICYTEPFRLLQSHLKKGIEQGEIQEQDCLIAGLSYAGITLRAVELRIEGIIDYPLTEIRDILVENGWNAIRTRPPRENHAPI